MADIIFDDLSFFVNKIKKKRTDNEIVFTNGCFDLLHPGHIYILKKAKSFGDLLVVGVNSDSSVKRLKGNSRPILNERDRSILVGALKPVDYVIIFKEATPLKTIKNLLPDVLVKGGEYSKKDIVGNQIVPRTVRIKMKTGYSTTAIIEKIKRNNFE